MLVLTRKSDEVLLIDGKIRVQVLSIDKGRVRLGITAPRSVPVARAELLPEAEQVATTSLSISSGCGSRPENEVNHDLAAIV